MSKNSLIFAGFILIISAFFSASQALADTPWVTGDQVRARIITAGPDAPQIAVEVTFGEGWHGYWRAPGDAGLAPVFDWTASENVQGADIFWPVPERFEEAGLTVFGYTDQVVFPVALRMTDESAPVRIALNLQIMVCKDICIPERLELHADLSPQKNPQSGARRRIDLAMRKIPAKEDTASLKIGSVILGPEGIVVAAEMKEGAGHADIFAAVEGRAMTAPPEITVTDQKSGAVLIKIPGPRSVDDFPASMKGKILSIVLSDGRRALEKEFAF